MVCDEKGRAVVRPEVGWVVGGVVGYVQGVLGMGGVPGRVQHS